MKQKLIILMTSLFILSSSASYAADFKISHPDQFGFHLIGTRLDASQMGASGLGLGAEIFLTYRLNQKWNCAVGLGIMTATDDVFKAQNQKSILLPSSEIRIGYSLTPSAIFHSFIYSGIHVFSEELRYKVNGQWESRRSGFAAAALLGLGLEVDFGSRGNKLSVAVDYRYTFLTGEETKSQYWVFKTGLTMALTKNAKSDPDKADYYDNLNAFMSDNEEGKVTNQADKNAAGENTVNRRLDMLESLAMSNAKTLENLHPSAKTPSAEPGAAETLAADMPVTAETYELHYKDGLALFRAVQYPKALEIFRALLNADNANALSSNSQYWIGECLYALGDYQQAITAFKKVLAFKESPKFDDAYLKIGLSYANMDDQAAAREAFETLIRKYPKSEYIERAKKYLNQ